MRRPGFFLNGLLALFPMVAMTTVCVAQESESQNAPQTRQAEAVSPTVYKKIEEVQALMDERPAEAREILEALLARDNLSAYERALSLQYLGTLHHNVGDTVEAVVAFGEILTIDGLEPHLYQRMRVTLAQLNMAVERYATAVTLLEDWFALESNPAPHMYALYGQALYQEGRYRDMIEPVRTAINLAQAGNSEVKEDWYALLAFGYFQTENYPALRDTVKEVLPLWPSKQYWMTLASTYTELGELDIATTTFSLAELQRFLQSESEIVTMAQLYMQRDLPYQAGTLLDAEMTAGRIDRSEDNLRLLAQAWSFAHETERTLAVLAYATTISDDGELSVRLGNEYLNMGQYRECAESIGDGIDKGGIRNPDWAYVSLGMCRYNLKQYDRAEAAFEEAKKAERSQRIANEWLRVISLDRIRDQEIAEAETNSRQQLERLAERRRSIRNSL